MIGKCIMTLQFLGSFITELPYKLNIVQDVESVYNHKTGHDEIIHVYPAGKKSTQQQINKSRFD